MEQSKIYPSKALLTKVIFILEIVSYFFSVIYGHKSCGVVAELYISAAGSLQVILFKRLMKKMVVTINML